MTEPYYDENDTGDGNDDGSEGGYGRVPRAKIRAWEKAEKDAKAFADKTAQLERRLALTEAGIGSLTERQQKAILATIDGDITADAARQAAEELGFVQPAAPAQDSDAEALNRMSQASAGALDPTTEDDVSRLERADREGGYDGLIAQLRADGSLVT